MVTLAQVELGVLGTLQVRQYGLPVAIPGAKPRAILTMLGLHGGAAVSADTLAELLWGADPPRTADKALQTHISALRRALGDGFVLTEGAGWMVNATEIDATRYRMAAKQGRDCAAAGDMNGAVARFDEALKLWRGIPELPEGPRAAAERTRWIEDHACVVEDRADALLATGRAAELIGELEAAIAEEPLRERRWGHLMLALYRAGRQGEALGAYQRARSLLADQLGVDPGPDLRRLEAAIVTQDDALDLAVLQKLSPVTRAVTFLLTDIEGSTAAWEANAAAMGVALARHDEIVEQVVTSRGGRLVKTRGEGDATFSVFDRPSAAAAAAVELQEAIRAEPWALAAPLRIRIALHTGEVELRDGDYFGRAVNRAARLRSLAAGGQILCSGATAELVIDTLADDVVLADLGLRQLKNLARPEHVFELRLMGVDEAPVEAETEAPIQRPELPSVLAGPGPFIGRGAELGRLLDGWRAMLADGTRAVLIAGEPGVGKTRLAGEWSRQAYEQSAVVLYGRCDEDLGVPYQPFAEALRSLMPCLGAARLRALRGVEALLPLVPGLADVVPDLSAPPRADADTERYALFDAVVAVLGVASADAPVVLVLDDLHWAAKPTLLLLRHLLRFGEHARVQIVGTYRSTDLDRSHPLAAMLADLHRDGTAGRIQLGGLDNTDVAAYVSESGYDDDDLARALATVTGGNPFFLIEALRHVAESGGHWDPSTLPQGVREAVSRRLSRLPAETNTALAAAAVVGSRFAVDLVEQVLDQDLIDAFDEASKAAIIIEEPGGRYRFNHAIVRQSLLAELASVRRMRLHQRIAAILETEPGADDELLPELAYHYFECAWAGNAAKAVDYCRRAADQAMARLAYEGAADLYDKALHALEELDDELPERDELRAELLITRCEALLTAGDVASATGAVTQLHSTAGDSVRLAAWGSCFDGELSILTDPERLDDTVVSVGAAAASLAALQDAAGEAKAHTVRATCLGRLGRVGECETALDEALTAARRAGDHRRVNAVLAGASVAALWGPNPVPRAGGRCLDVVRLLRITTDSPAVEAISTRCQAVLEAFRDRGAAARRMIESARRTVTELGLRHALLEVEQFAGIVELVLDDPAAAESHLRRAYNGFRRMRLDADTAETAALLARACLTLGRDGEADELCTESERLAGHALKASIAWRTVRAQLLARDGSHEQARQVAEEAVALAGRTDGLVDHGDACLALATVLAAAGDGAGARAAAEQAIGLYEEKGAAALAAKARGLLGESEHPSVPDNACVPVINQPATAAHRDIEDLDAPLDAVHARVAAGPRAALENAASRVVDRGIEVFAGGRWDGLGAVYGPNAQLDDRRRGLRLKTSGLAAQVANIRTTSDLGATNMSPTTLALRGDRLWLGRVTVEQRDGFDTEALVVIEIDADGLIVNMVAFDPDNFDGALAELDARYLAGEAAEHARSWSVVLQMYSALNRRELPATTPDWVCVDHQRGRALTFASGEAVADIRASWDQLPTGRTHIDAVHRLTDSGVVVTHTARATSHAGFDAEWRFVNVLILDGDLISRCEMFGESDLDIALARFDQLSRPAPRLDNTAMQVSDRFRERFIARDWEAMAQMVTSDISFDDRRPVANAGLQTGRDAFIENFRIAADLGAAQTPEAIATRGDRVVLTRARFARGDGDPGEFGLDLLHVIEIDAEDRVAATVTFDPDDIDAAFDELDTRYLAGEAAPYARTWSFLTTATAALNRRELPPTTPDWVNIDRRRIAPIAAGDLNELLQTSWDATADARYCIEAVHRLDDLGWVVTYASAGTSRDGFDAEWRVIVMSTFDGDLINRCEIFDEDDLDTALARFDELSRPAPRLENAASRADMRFQKCFADRDFDRMAEMLTDGTVIEDRRRTVNAGYLRGRDAEAGVHAYTDAGSQNVTATVIGIRGEHLALSHYHFFGDDQGPDSFRIELLAVVEIDSDERMAAVITFDLDDIDAAFAELDARYLAGEAAPYADTWSVIARTIHAANRHELPSTTPDWVSVNHQRLIAFEPGGLKDYIRSSWEDMPDGRTYIEAVHRLSDRGAVIAHAAEGTTPGGFAAEWRGIDIMMIEGELISRSEMFDEDDLDTALVRFDELSRSTPQLQNAASRVLERFQACFAARDWDETAEILAADFCSDDRRRVVGSGLVKGRDAEIADLRAIAEIGIQTFTWDVVAIRGQHLLLGRSRFRGEDLGPGELYVDVLGVVEIDSDERMAAIITFDPDDIDAAFAELDARYLAGEAAEHARAWSAIAAAGVAFNRHEPLPTTPDWVNVDHRRGIAFTPGDMGEYVRATWDVAPDVKNRIAVVHRLNDLGALITHVTTGTSKDGVAAEWREGAILTVEGDLINRIEVFDEDDLDTALARFDELSRPPRLENTATRLYPRYNADFVARRWDALADLMTEDIYVDDRRRVVSGGILRGRDAQIANIRAVADVGVKSLESTAIATRGERLALIRAGISGGRRPGAFSLEMLIVLDVDADNRFAATVLFDPDDLHAAVAELDARYLAGEAAPHARTWSVIMRSYDAFNRRTQFPTTADWVSVDHRRGAAFAPGDLIAYIDAALEDSPDTGIYVEEVHRLSDLGAVVTHKARGTSNDGFDAEWQDINVATVDGDLANRSELFDEADLDAALARFDELSQPLAPRLENAASQVVERFRTRFAARDWDTTAAMLTDDFLNDDRRRVVGSGVRRGRDASLADMQATADLFTSNVAFTVMATRGERLVLARSNFADRERGFRSEALSMIEINADEKFSALVTFDPDDLDAALAELDARYLVGEAAEHAHAWQVIAGNYTAINRHEIPKLPPDWVNIDHRIGVTIAPGDMMAVQRAAWADAPDSKTYVEAVHQLGKLGAVVTQVTTGTSELGFEAEWRMIALSTVDGELCDRCETFDEADLDAALARFAELSHPAPGLENLATRSYRRMVSHYGVRDWDAITALLAHDIVIEDRRRVVNAGLREGRETAIEDILAIASVGVTYLAFDTIATRGKYLALNRSHSSVGDGQADEFGSVVLDVIEVDSEGRLLARIVFDPDDLDAAFAELDARYLAGEAAEHAHTWSLVTQTYAAFNRHELSPVAPDWINIDHRGLGSAPGEMRSDVSAMWSVTPDVSSRINAVHRLTDLGAVFSHTERGTSTAGFDAEWCEVALLTFEGDEINRCEIFDDDDLDAALARFDEL